MARGRSQTRPRPAAGRPRTRWRCSHRPSPLGGGGEPAELHRVAEYLWRAPGLPVVKRGRESDLYLAGAAAATRIGVEVVRERELRAGARRGAAGGEAGDEVVDVAADRVERDAADRRPGGTIWSRSARRRSRWRHRHRS